MKWALVLWLSGCSGVWLPDYRIEEAHVRWIRVAPERMNEVCGKGTLGCAKQKDLDSCTVFAPRPIDDLDEKGFAILGEEVAHCFYGDFHE